jgi:hypothetical protein
MGREEDVISIGVNAFKGSIHEGPIKEENIFLSPYSQKWVRWKLREVNNYLLKKALLKTAQRRIDDVITSYSYDIMHIVNHGLLSAYPCREKYLKEKKLWVSFHDHYSEGSSFEDAKKLWQHAHRRIVISKELGMKYAEEFGNKNFEIITDGLLENEISEPKHKSKDTITIYFGGLLHYHYIPLFKVLEDVLNTIAKQGIKINFILRGVSFTLFKNNLFNVQYRNDFVSDAEIQKELNEADILYLPIKFNNPEFYLYSLSTKMIGYLGAPGIILYHGPAGSAAFKLLNEEKAAVCCTSMEATGMLNALSALINNAEKVSANAKRLARGRFELKAIQRSFWIGQL